MSLTRKVGTWKQKCVACGASYHPVWLIDMDARICQNVSHHVCNPRAIRRKEAKLREQFADVHEDGPESIDDAFEIAELMSDGME